MGYLASKGYCTPLQEYALEKFLGRNNPGRWVNIRFRLYSNRKAPQYEFKVLYGWCPNSLRHKVAWGWASYKVSTVNGPIGGVLNTLLLDSIVDLVLENEGIHGQVRCELRRGDGTTR